MKPRLYFHVGQAGHFLAWEMAYWAQYFDLRDSPGPRTVIMAFGPDVMDEAAHLPALRRYITTFPGFRHNPLHNQERLTEHSRSLSFYDAVFVNRGPLELAYAHLPNVEFYPFSVDVDHIPWRIRHGLRSLLHVSSDSPQKDWRRSEDIMRATTLRYEVFPPRTPRKASGGARFLSRVIQRLRPNRKTIPHGYVDHGRVMRKYLAYDGFVHVAKDIRSPLYIDGKYTASLVEAGVSGALLFWHDTLALGNEHETVFALPLDPKEAATAILDIRGSVDVARHSRATREEMSAKYHPGSSIAVRAERMLRDL